MGAGAEWDVDSLTSWLSVWGSLAPSCCQGPQVEPHFPAWGMPMLGCSDQLVPLWKLWALLIGGLHTCGVQNKLTKLVHFFRLMLGGVPSPLHGAGGPNSETANPLGLRDEPALPL